MAEIAEMHAEIVRRIQHQMELNELAIAHWGECPIGSMGMRRQVEIAEKTVGLIMALEIVNVVMGQPADAPSGGV